MAVLGQRISIASLVTTLVSIIVLIITTLVSCKQIDPDFSLYAIKRNEKLWAQR